MHFSNPLCQLALTTLSLAMGASAAAVEDAVLATRYQPRAVSFELEQRDDQYDPANYAGAIATAAGGGAVCEVAGPLAVACVGATAAGLASEITFCTHCLINEECTPGDAQAIDAASVSLTRAFLASVQRFNEDLLTRAFTSEET